MRLQRDAAKRRAPEACRSTKRMSNSDISALTWEWWPAHRRQYNVGLVIAGILAFVCYVAVIAAFEHRIPDVEITLFTTIFQGVGYLFMMALANICYFLGPVTESIVKPIDPQRFRSITFGLGYWGSVMLPFVIPASLLIMIIFQPT